MVNWFSLLAQAMLPNQLGPGLGRGLGQGLGQGLTSTQDEYEYNDSPGYNPQPRSLFPVSSSNPFLNNRMMVMMMLEKMRANRVSLLLKLSFVHIMVSSYCRFEKLVIAPSWSLQL